MKLKAVENSGKPDATIDQTRNPKFSRTDPQKHPGLTAPSVVLFAKSGSSHPEPPPVNINMTLAYCSSSSTVVVTRPLGFLTLTAWT